MVIYHFTMVNLPLLLSTCNLRPYPIFRLAVRLARCLCVAMSKRKATAAPLEATEDQRGGKRSNAGAKAKPKGLGAPSNTQSKLVTPTLSTLLGKRRMEHAAAVAAGTCSAAVREISWQYAQHDGGADETLVQQRQLVGGLVQIGMDAANTFTLLEKGTSEMKYLHDTERGHPRCGQPQASRSRAGSESWSRICEAEGHRAVCGWA